MSVALHATLHAVIGALSLLGEAEPLVEPQYKRPEVWSFVMAGWALTIVGIGLYALMTLRRGRALARQLPVEERRWM